MSELHLACIVEGKGERPALPKLLRRIVEQITAYQVALPTPPMKKLDRAKLSHPGELERAVEYLARNAPNAALLIVMDGDDDCPVNLGADLLRRAKAARPDRRISVVIVQREFEAWFIAAAKSLGIETTDPRGPEEIRGAKQWLNEHRPPYRASIDQERLAATFDLDEARTNSRSFRKLWKEVEILLAEVS